jgi:hypothetical protein
MVEVQLWQMAHDSITRDSDGEWSAVALTASEERTCRQLAAVARQEEVEQLR